MRGSTGSCRCILADTLTNALLTLNIGSVMDLKTSCKWEPSELSVSPSVLLLLLLPLLLRHHHCHHHLTISSPTQQRCILKLGCKQRAQMLAQTSCSSAAGTCSVSYISQSHALPPPPAPLSPSNCTHSTTCVSPERSMQRAYVLSRDTCRRMAATSAQGCLCPPLLHVHQSPPPPASPPASN